MKQLTYHFKDKTILDLALTQSGADAVNNNERLEFIGDRVLGLTVAVLLFDMFPNESEGELARRHASLVSTETLANVAMGFGLDKTLRRNIHQNWAPRHHHTQRPVFGATKSGTAVTAVFF
jgi:ribonuclease-3